jgi:preprotein translocase subunit SecF
MHLALPAGNVKFGRERGMLKKILSLMLVGLLLNVIGASTAYAGSREEKEARFVKKVKEGIGKLGTGREARVEVKLRDKTKLKGYVSEAGEDSFVVVDDKTGAASTVAYPQVQQVKGNNLSKAAKIALGVGVILLPIIIAVIFIPET